MLGQTDLPIGSVKDATFCQAGTRGILHAMATGRHARQLAEMDPDQRIAYTALHMDRVFPGALDHVEGGHFHDWDAEEWSRGDYAYYEPGTFLRIFPHAGRAEARVHFAGDQTSHKPGWLDGAIYSGHRAAREIHEAPEPGTPLVATGEQPAGAL
jgi:monoamine oxidase